MLCNSLGIYCFASNFSAPPPLQILGANAWYVLVLSSLSCAQIAVHLRWPCVLDLTSTLFNIVKPSHSLCILKVEAVLICGIAAA